MVHAGPPGSEQPGARLMLEEAQWILTMPKTGGLGPAQLIYACHQQNQTAQRRWKLQAHRVEHSGIFTKHLRAGEQHRKTGPYESIGCAEQPEPDRALRIPEQAAAIDQNHRQGRRQHHCLHHRQPHAQHEQPLRGKPVGRWHLHFAHGGHQRSLARRPIPGQRAEPEHADGGGCRSPVDTTSRE